jgi:hypothetical protein
MADFSIRNAPENLTMTDMLAKVPKGLAKSCRFVVKFSASGGPNNKLLSGQFTSILNDLTYLCEAAELPGRSLVGVDLRYYGPTFRLPFQSAYEDVTFTFLCRTDSRERQFFDDWMNIINPMNTWDFAYRSEYAAKIQIFQLADAAAAITAGPATAPEATYAITMIDTYPVTINPQPVAWADDNFQRLTVTFTHDGWYREGRAMNGQQEWPPKTRNELVKGAGNTLTNQLPPLPTVVTASGGNGSSGGGRGGGSGTGW